MLRWIHRCMAVAAVLCASACDLPHAIVTADTDPMCWSEAAALGLHNEDTAALRDLRLIIRYNIAFRTDTLALEIAAEAPDSAVYRDTVRLRVPRTTEAAALKRDLSIPYRCDVRFPQAGEYHLYVMPLAPVRGVEAVGVEMITKKEIQR